MENVAVRTLTPGERAALGQDDPEPAPQAVKVFFIIVAGLHLFVWFSLPAMLTTGAMLLIFGTAYPLAAVLAGVAAGVIASATGILRFICRESRSAALMREWRKAHNGPVEFHRFEATAAVAIVPFEGDEDDSFRFIVDIGGGRLMYVEDPLPCGIWCEDEPPPFTQNIFPNTRFDLVRLPPDGHFARCVIGVFVHGAPLKPVQILRREDCDELPFCIESGTVFSGTLATWKTDLPA